MLTRLRVKNYALIDELNIFFEKGLNILTGVTGAGKSILIGSMNLILGEKASPEMIRSGENQAWVEATFQYDSPPPEAIVPHLTEGDGSFFLKRQVMKEGRSFAFVNDQQVTLATLKGIGSAIADLVGQHSHQSLLNPLIHQQLLDRFSLKPDLLGTYREAFFKLKGAEKSLNELIELDRISKERRELYRFQVQEIDRAKLEPREEETLKREYTILKNSREIATRADQILYGLTEKEESALTQLKTLLKEFELLGQLDPSLKEKLSVWKESVFTLEDLSQDLSRYRDLIPSDPQRMEQVEERLTLYADLAKKYGGGYIGDTEGSQYEAIMNYRSRIEEDLTKLENLEDQINRLQGEIFRLKETVLQLGKEISRGRIGGSERLKKKAEEELRELGMKGTRFELHFSPILKEEASGELFDSGEIIYASDQGLERVEFLIAPNPGEPLKPLVKIASGGEISRIMLAIKSVLAEVDNIPLLIFDEVDVGIGGEVASLVGKKLKKLSRNHQVICITHLQQIAAYADCHFCVVKSLKGSRTVTEVNKLSQEERIGEIARMISGEEVSDLSLKHAREFLSEAQSYSVSAP